MVWYSHLLKNFPQFIVIHTVKIFGIARRDKKAFLRNQYKEIEDNSRMGKTRDLFKNIRDTKGTLHAKMGSIKDRNGMDITEEEILRRGGKNTEKNYTERSS